LARFFAHTQASDSISATERSVDKRAELIERRVAGALSSWTAFRFLLFSFQPASSLVERSNPPVLASVN
jgi:hypothetical protein